MFMMHNYFNQACRTKITFLQSGLVRKTLVNSEDIYYHRFSQEIDILYQLQKFQSIVRICDANVGCDGMPYYDMWRYQGNANLLLAKTKGHVQYTVKLLYPIVKALKLLSEMEFPIYHKDLKPENLLVNEQERLMLADFGCAIMKDDGKNRITSNMRMMGERSFLAPEYADSQIEALTSKADIFSIGKLLWYFVNGDENEVFPGALCCDPDYDITKRFPGVGHMQQLQQIIILTTCRIPEQRIGYDQLLSLLRYTQNT